MRVPTAAERRRARRRFHAKRGEALVRIRQTEVGDDAFRERAAAQQTVLGLVEFRAGAEGFDRVLVLGAQDAGGLAVDLHRRHGRVDRLHQQGEGGGDDDRGQECPDDDEAMLVGQLPISPQVDGRRIVGLVVQRGAVAVP
jgi:hypothetical protein